MDNEQPHQELVKCVVVGDTAVGKTRLICARACNARLTLQQLMNTHIPTVWAIDQYRIYKEVLERSWEVVDGVSVSLRLWDTFGDHDKDRRFAYGRSDVVLLCFSIANPISLRNCKSVWFPEIRRFCPTTPIILVGCKNDLRYMYRDEEFLTLCRDRSPFFRPLRETDILTPEQGRLVAKEMGAPYYETSVLTHYGVHQVFENVIRAALLSRRQQRFWMTNLKHVQRPLLQVPFCPPKPPPPELTVPVSQFEDDLLAVLQSQAYSDVAFVLGKTACVPAHRVLLAAVSNTFYKLFTLHLSSDLQLLGARSASDSSMMSTLEACIGNFNSDTERLIEESSPCSNRATSFRLRRGITNQQQSTLTRRRSSCQIQQQQQQQMSMAGDLDTGSMLGSTVLLVGGNRVQRTLNHQAFLSIGVEQDECNPSLSRVVISLAKAISASVLQVCLRFLYTGVLDLKHNVTWTDVQKASELMDLPELHAFASNLLNREGFLNTELQQHFLQKLRTRLKEICLDQGLFAEVEFKLEDGTCSAHRPVLMARCDMMAAMFRGDFMESSARVIHFPGVKRECFRQLLVYLYTDEVDPSVSSSNCLELLELANRLCLLRLVALVEQHIVRELCRLSDSGCDMTEQTIRLLEPCQLHNADQLADWCLYYIAVNYNDICHRNSKLLRSLHPENQAYLNRNRWPPIWYLKEFDYYERCVRERQWQEKPPKAWKRYHTSSSGCLCFSGKKGSGDSKRAYRTV